MFEEYADIEDKDERVIAHYWNPSNYNNDDDILLPIELADPKYFPHDYDSMDKLYYAVNNYYPHQFRPD